MPGRQPIPRIYQALCSSRTFVRPLQIGLCAALSLSLLIPPASLARASGKLPQRDFLPPVASINPRMEQIEAAAEDSEVEAVQLAAVSSPVIHKTPRVARLEGSLTEAAQSDQTKTILALQKQVDEADLEALWRATVERNPVIRFSLEKLAMPPDLLPSHSSMFLRRTLSTAISGASIAGSMLVPGGGQYRNMAVMAGNNALQNLVTGRTQPTPGALSPTEQIQMAGMIDDLKMRLIQTYQGYKSALQTLADAHQTTLRNNNQYSKALASKNDLAIMAAATAYYQAMSHETKLRQQAKLQRLALERLAGSEIVAQLVLTVGTDELAAAAKAAPPEPVSHLDETIGPSPALGPEPPSTKNKRNANRSAPIQSAGNAKASPLSMPTELPEAMEIGPSLSNEIGPPAPIAMPAIVSQPRRGKRNTAAGIKNTLPAPMPEIVRP